MTQRISILLPVHQGIEPEHLSRALQSIKEQTHPADEFVLVEDGPLTAGLYHVLDNFNAPANVVRVVLPVNGGAGVANETGLQAATGDLIAKMDADDVAVPHRLERQLAFMQETGADVCGAAMLEFHIDEENPTRLRTSPLTHRSIERRMVINSPINHPTAMYRRSIALAAGGYGDLRFMQDYQLFARMLAAGAKFANLEEPLVLFRANDRMYQRRRSRAMIRCEWALQAELRRLGIVGPLRRWVNLALRLCFRRLPTPLLVAAYRLLFNRPLRGKTADLQRPLV